MYVVTVVCDTVSFSSAQSHTQHKRKREKRQLFPPFLFLPSPKTPNGLCSMYAYDRKEHKFWEHRRPRSVREAQCQSPASKLVITYDEFKVTEK